MTKAETLLVERRWLKSCLLVLDKKISRLVAWVEGVGDEESPEIQAQNDIYFDEWYSEIDFINSRLAEIKTELEKERTK